uniref:Uncharacterized protein n=1 Tax=Setaria viridis TaxID=4556 RepID=A0A4U6TJ31_SETVI|nr:hypothetical protein SEVIR_8G242300v2 [Setaria viridis]
MNLSDSYAFASSTSTDIASPFSTDFFCFHFLLHLVRDCLLFLHEFLCLLHNFFPFLLHFDRECCLLFLPGFLHLLLCFRILLHLVRNCLLFVHGFFCVLLLFCFLHHLCCRVHLGIFQSHHKTCQAHSRILLLRGHGHQVTFSATSAGDMSISSKS